MDENVSKAVAAADAAMVGCGDTEGVRLWQTIRARLVELEAENERLQSGLATHADRVCELQSRLAAADALLRECTRYLNPHHFPDTIKRIDAHLSELGT